MSMKSDAQHVAAHEPAAAAPIPVPVGAMLRAPLACRALLAAQHHAASPPREGLPPGGARCRDGAGIPPQGVPRRAPVYPRLLDELVPSALHTVGQYANNPIEADHGRLNARLRPMRGLKRHRSAPILAAGHAFMRNLRRGHYDIATDVRDHHRLRKAFDGLAITIRSAAHSSDHALTVYRMAQRNSASA